MISARARPQPGVGPYRSPCGCAGEIAEPRRQPWVKPDKAITYAVDRVRQAKQSDEITGTGCLFCRCEL